MTDFINKSIIATMRGAIRRTNHVIPGRLRALALDLVIQDSVDSTSITYKIKARPTTALQPVSKLCEITLLILGVPTFSITDLLAQRSRQFSKISKAGNNTTAYSQYSAKEEALDATLSGPNRGTNLSSRPTRSRPSRYISKPNSQCTIISPSCRALRFPS